MASGMKIEKEKFHIFERLTVKSGKLLIMERFLIKHFQPLKKLSIF
jgi:hypothetical protein